MTLSTELLISVEAIMENLQARRAFEWDEDYNPSDSQLLDMAEEMHDDGVLTEAQIDCWLMEYC